MAKANSRASLVAAQTPLSLASDLKKVEKYSVLAQSETIPTVDEEEEESVAQQEPMGMTDEEEEEGISAEIIGHFVSEEEDESDEEDRDTTDDTFFHQAKPISSFPTASAEEEEPAFVHPPLALAASRFAHLYDDPIEKPPLPAQIWTPALPDSNGTSLQQNDGPTTPSQAQKLFSYLGSLVQRTPTTPTQSHSPSSVASSPESDCSDASFQASLVDINQRTLPSDLHNHIPSLPVHPSPLRRIRSLPIVEMGTTPSPIVSTSRGTPLLRRRSDEESAVSYQGEAIESSNRVPIAREEEEELSISGGLKRKAEEDLKRVGNSLGMMPSGIMAIDRPFGIKVKSRRGV